MANTKQISQLNPTASVNSTDQLPLAQQGSSEAVRATVSQLAQAVGELNETGAYSELTLATSIGKNILAQRLTEKGIQTSPTETLVQMADKVNSLQVLNSTSLGMSNLVIESTNTDVTAGNAYGRFHATRMKNGYTAIVAAGKIYICETEGDYSSLSDFISSAIASIDQINASASNNRAYIAASEDGSKLATYDYNGHIDIYSIDYENEVITYESTVDASGTYGSESLQLAINNAGTFVAYFYSWDSTFRIQSVVDDTKVVTFSIYSSLSYNGNGGLAFDNTDPNVLYSVTLNNTNYSSEFYTSKITYDFTSSTPTATVETIIKNLKGSFDPYNKLVINTASIERPQNNNNLIKLNFNIYDLVREQPTNNVSCAFSVDALNQTYNDPAYISWNYGLSWTYIETVNGELVYKCHQPKLTLKYNPSTNTLVLEGADYQVFQFSANSPLINSNSTYPAYLLAYDQDMNKLIIIQSNTLPYYSEYGMVQYVRYCALSSDNKLLGLISKDSSGNLRTLYYVLNYLIADVLAGKYDLDTNVVYLS